MKRAGLYSPFSLWYNLPMQGLNTLPSDYRGPLPMLASPMSSFGGGGIMSVLQPFGNYLTNQVAETTRQRVEPFLDRVSQMATEEFGLQPQAPVSSGFGGGLPSLFNPPQQPLASFNLTQQPLASFNPTQQPPASSTLGQLSGMGTGLTLLKDSLYA